jgi:hypothetical protein
MNVENTKEHNTRETSIYMVHPIWATSMEKQPILSLIHPTKRRDNTYNTFVATSSSLSHNILSQSQYNLSPHTVAIQCPPKKRVNF